MNIMSFLLSYDYLHLIVEIVGRASRAECSSVTSGHPNSKIRLSSESEIILNTSASILNYSLT